jgi:hypothetical protein
VLVPLAQRAAMEARRHPGLPLGFGLDVLGQPHESSGTSFGNALRIGAGGAVPSVDRSTDDELSRLLLQMAVDQYPALLIPSEPWQPPVSLSLFRHPYAEDVIAIVTSDPDLSRLFPDEDEGLGSGRIGFVYSSLGRGFTLQTVSFAPAILRSAWDAAAMTVAQPSIEQLAERVLAHLVVVRCAATGEAAQVRALVAFTGFTTEGDARISTPWGPLRP